MNSENLDIELNASLKEIDAVNSSYHIAVKPDRELALFLFKKDKIDYIYNVCSLEGNPMTFPKTCRTDSVTAGEAGRGNNARAGRRKQPRKNLKRSKNLR